MSLTKTPPKNVHQRKGSFRNSQKHPSSILQEKDASASPVKKKKYGLKITTHGLRKPIVVKKGRHCTCDMCSNKYQSSTAFIEHYKTTHPALKCKDCDKVYNNPLSLQKHRYVHLQDKQEQGSHLASCRAVFVLVSMWLPQQHMVSIWTPHGIHVETLWCTV